jgi:hypothetical protein
MGSLISTKRSGTGNPGDRGSGVFTSGNAAGGNVDESFVAPTPVVQNAKGSES